MAILFGNIGHHDASGLKIWRLEVSKEAVLVSRVRRDTVIADQRLSEDQDLSTIRGIGQGLRVSDKRGGEDGFSGNIGLGTKRLSIEHRSILKVPSAMYCESSGLYTCPDCERGSIVRDWRGSRPGRIGRYSRGIPIDGSKRTSLLC